jgi:hypothetical protein
VETDYREVPDEAERLKRAVRILSEGIYAYLKRRGQLTKNGPLEGHEPQGQDSR